MNKDIRSWSPILKDIDNIYDYYENLCNYLFSYVKPDEDLKPIGCECGFPPFIFFHTGGLLFHPPLSLPSLLPTRIRVL